MSKTPAIIEINGKRYDAHSGALVSHGQPRQPLAEIHHNKSALPHPKPPAHLKTEVHRQPAAHAAAHSPKSSVTLMRQAVKKPAVHRAHIKHELDRNPEVSIEVKRSFTRVDDHRLKKAKQVPQSHLIKHFTPASEQAATFVPVAVHKPAAAAQPEPVQLPAKAATHHNRTSDLLEQALKHANSHEQPAHHHRARRHKSRSGVVMAVAAFLLAIGYLGYQQVPSLRFKSAVAKAGISASMPGYQPPGFSLQQMESGPGIVATQYQSNSDQRAYTVLQQQTNWDSLALRQNFVIAKDMTYKVIEANGRQIHIYNGSNATWVSNGIWYQIQTNGSLSQNQLVDIAKSL